MIYVNQQNINDYLVNYLLFIKMRKKKTQQNSKMFKRCYTVNWEKKDFSGKNN